jgi:hypothetical protein
VVPGLRKEHLPSLPPLVSSESGAVHAEAFCLFHFDWPDHVPQPANRLFWGMAAFLLPPGPDTCLEWTTWMTAVKRVRVRHFNLAQPLRTGKIGGECRGGSVRLAGGAGSGGVRGCDAAAAATVLSAAAERRDGGGARWDQG